MSTDQALHVRRVCLLFCIVSAAPYLSCAGGACVKTTTLGKPFGLQANQSLVSLYRLLGETPPRPISFENMSSDLAFVCSLLVTMLGVHELDVHASNPARQLS